MDETFNIKRQRALTWWKALLADTTFDSNGKMGFRRAWDMMEKHIGVDRQVSSLTGREIEIIWSHEYDK